MRFKDTVCLLALAFSPIAFAANGVLPDSLSAAIIAKVLSFESSSNTESDLRIHVFDSESLAKELQALEGVPVGKGRLGKTSYGANAPNEKIDVVVASSADAMRIALEYAEKNGAVSATNNPKLVELGVSLTVFDDDGLPGILLSRKGAQREGLYWEPEILEIAKMASEK